MSRSVGGHFVLHGLAGQVGHRVFHQVELATLPRDARKAGGAGLFQPRMVVTDDVAAAVQAAGQEPLEELPPMNFSLAVGNAHAQDRAMAFRRDADGDQQRHVDHRPLMANVLVAGVEDQVRDLAQRPLTPTLQLLVELGRQAAHGGTGNLVAAQLLDDPRDLAGRDAADIHLGQRGGQCPLAADAALECLRIEVDVACLGDSQVQIADAAVQRLALEPVGVALDDPRFARKAPPAAPRMRSSFITSFSSSSNAAARPSNPCSASSWTASRLPVNCGGWVIRGSP